MAMFAHTFLAVLAHRHRAKKGAPYPAAPNPPVATATGTSETTDNTTHSAPEPSLRRRIRLSLAEIRRLFDLRDQAKRPRSHGDEMVHLPP